MHTMDTLHDNDNSSEDSSISRTVPCSLSRLLFTQPGEVDCYYYTPAPHGETEAQQGGAPPCPGCPGIINVSF